MKFTIERSHFIKPLQQVSGTLGGRASLPILGNLLIKVEDNQLSMTATDLEVELISRVTLEGILKRAALPFRRVNFLISAEVCQIQR